MAADTRRWLVFEDGPAADVWVVEVDDLEPWTYSRAGGAHATCVAEYKAESGGREAAERDARERLALFVR